MDGLMYIAQAQGAIVRKDVGKPAVSAKFCLQISNYSRSKHVLVPGIEYTLTHAKLTIKSWTVVEYNAHYV